jgi:hypothetical protein
MALIPVTIALLNLLLSLGRLYATFSQRRLIATVWFLISYFSFFELLLVFHGPFSHLSGMYGKMIYVNYDTIEYVSGYVLVCNILFAVSEMVVWRLFGRRCTDETWRVPRNFRLANAFRYIMAPVLIVSVAWYAIKMRGLGYAGYVGFKESNWPAVFTGASTPLISVCMMQRRYFWAMVATIPFIWFIFQMSIRSFALMSLIPVAAIVVYQRATAAESSKGGRAKFMIVAAGILSLLLCLGGLVSFFKSGHFEFPDAGLPQGMNVAVKQAAALKSYTGWNSLEIYGTNIISPFYRLFNVKIPRIISTPEHIAWLLEGVPPGGFSFFHFPMLWYSDAFVSFGAAGVFLGILWGVLISLAEAIMYRSSMLLAVLLPYYVWHWYMVCRGATDIATVQTAYCLYITIFFFMFARLFSAGGPAPRRETA